MLLLPGRRAEIACYVRHQWGRAQKSWSNVGSLLIIQGSSLTYNSKLSFTCNPQWFYCRSAEAERLSHCLIAVRPLSWVAMNKVSLIWAVENG